MLNFVFRTDVHLADRGPVSWKGDYLGELWDNLRQVAKIASDTEAVAILDGGDLFHVKAPARNSHFLVNETIKLHKESPCPVFSIEGNHDLQNNNLCSLSKQPLGVVFASGVLHPLREEVFSRGGITVRVVGLPFIPDRTLDTFTSIRKKPGDDFLVVIAHALASEEPPASVVDFFGEPVFKYSDLIVPDGPDLLCFGHWHKDQGITEIDGRFFVNPGALSRGSLSFETLSRTPSATLLSFGVTGIKVVSYPLTVAPAEDVFNFEVKQAKEEEAVRIQAFLDDLNSKLSDASLQGVSVKSALQSLQVSQKVRDTALRYLEMVGIG